jgi:hypothetical protein
MKCPDFVALDAAHAEITDVRMMVSRARASHVVQQSENCVLPNAQHPASSVDGISFDEGANDSALRFNRKAIYDGSSLRNRSRISQENNALDFRDRLRIIKSVAKKRKNPYAVALGRKGGRKGGPARAANMTPQERSESARNAVMARWAKVKQQNDR